MPERPNWISTGLFTRCPSFKLMKYSFAPGVEAVCASARPAPIVNAAAAAKSFNRIVVSNLFRSPNRLPEKSYALGQLALVVLVEEFRQHARGDAVFRDRRLPIGTHLRVFHPIRDRSATFGNVHGGVIDVPFAGRAGF